MNAGQRFMSTSVVHSGRRLEEHLNSLVSKKDLGALALLRRGLGRQPGEVLEMFAHVLPCLSTPHTVGSAQREREENAGLLVASLYAQWHQGKAQSRSAAHMSVGAAYRQLANTTDSGSIEQRFVALLKSSRERMPDHLRHAVSLFKAKDIPLDWALLFSDLVTWEQPVRRRWARDYWERTRPSETTVNDGSASTAERVGTEEEA